MEEIKNKILVTAALPYINNVPHLGHIVGSHLPADIFTRYCRLKGKEVVFLGGADENGTPSELAAEEIGIDKKVFCEKLYKEHKKVYDWFDISYDIFSRTSESSHHKTVQSFFKQVYDNDYIEEKDLKMPYCEKCERVLADRYVEGRCPNCGYQWAHGNQCEKCGRLLNPDELKNPKCATCSSSPVFKTFSHLFFRLDKLSGALKKWIGTKSFWDPYVLGMAKGLLKEGLKPRCVTRNLETGVRVPIEDHKDKVIFVWFEALLGYVSFLKESYPECWKEYWEKEGSQIFNFLGKDNIPFHAVFFPAMLMAQGDFNLPYKVVGLQYLNYEGQKFSKSKGVGVFCEKLPEAGLEPDYWRFYLSFLIPETSDTNFSWEDFEGKINGELIGNFSNFIYRSLSFVENKFGGRVRPPSADNFTKRENDLSRKIRDKISKIDSLLASTQLRKALQEILSVAEEGNRYFDQTAPWSLVKNKKEKAEMVLYTCLELSRILSVLISPFLPTTAKKIQKQLGIRKEEVSAWGGLGQSFLAGSDYILENPEILFEKIDKEKIVHLKEAATGPRDIKSFFYE